MPRARCVRPIVFVLTALLILISAMHLAAQKGPKDEKTDEYGAGSGLRTYYNDDGSIYRIEHTDAKDVLRGVDTYSYDPDTHNLIQIASERFRADGSLQFDDIHYYAPNGHITKTWFRSYDTTGNQTSGLIWDLTTNKNLYWHASTGEYNEENPRPLPPIRIESGLNLGKVSYQPVELGMIVPSNLSSDETLSGTVMPANEAKNYSNVPGFTVKTFTASLPGGQFSPLGYQGLNIGTTQSGSSPVIAGCFTTNVPHGTTNFSLIGQQEFTPKATPSTIGISLTTPPWADEPVIHRPVWNGGGLEYWLDYLNYLWFKVTDYEEEYWDAYHDGAPDWVLDEIEEDQDYAQDAADFLAFHLPLDAVRKLAAKKADWEHWLDDTYHGGMSYVHKDNVDFYVNYAVPQDYLFRKIAYSLVAPPILQVGRLGVLRGDFSGDCGSTRATVDGTPVRFITSNQSSYYFMPPETITPGAHTLDVWNGPFRYAFPVFFMKLSMSIDIQNLHTKIYPTSTMWHLVLTGLNGMPSSYWTGGGYSPDLVSLSDLGTLPQGFQIPGQTRQGNIVVRITNQSPQIISVPEIPGGQRTWVLDAQNFAPLGEFHVDANANALRDGNFSIFGLAVATLKPIEGIPAMPGFPSSGTPGSTTPTPNPPEELSTSASALRNTSYRVVEGEGVSRSEAHFDHSLEQTVQEAGQAYVAAQQMTKTKRLAMIEAWTKALAGARPQLRSSYEAAGKEYGTAFLAWKNSFKEFKASPSDDNRKKVDQLRQDRLRKKVKFDSAREAVLNATNPATRDAWHAAVDEYKSAAERQAHVRIGLEQVWKTSTAPK